MPPTSSTPAPQSANTPTQQSIQDRLLTQLKTAEMAVSCFLVNGVRLSGIVVGFDRYTVTLSNSRPGSSPQMINKSAISTILPNGGTERQT